MLVQHIYNTLNKKQLVKNVWKYFNKIAFIGGYLKEILENTIFMLKIN